MKLRFPQAIIVGIAAIAVVRLSPAAAQADRTGARPFWPAGAEITSGIEQSWTTWVTRCDVRAVPTTPFSAPARLAALRLWMAELAASGVPVADVVARDTLNRLAQMAGQRNGDARALSRALDAAFRGLEALAGDRGVGPEAGEINGRIVGPQGEPLAGVDVVLLGTPLGAVTGSDGSFRIGAVPSVGTRWTLWAHKEGYLDSYTGRLAPSPARPAEAAIRLDLATAQNRYLDQPLIVRFARLVDVKQTADPAQPIELAARTPEGYPDTVRPYLAPAPWVDSQHPAVQEQAQQIAASVSETDRARSTPIARAILAWVARNIATDAENQTVADPATAQWQFRYGAWSAGMGDWLRLPSEVLAEKHGSSAEVSRLAAAMMRALGIAARPVTTWDGHACQWWVQLPAGNGYWVTADVDLLRANAARTGKADLQQALVCDDAVGSYGVDERADIHMSWQSAAPLLWCGEDGETNSAGRSPGGLASAQGWMATFARQGSLPGGRPIRPSSGSAANRANPAYVTAWSGVVLDLHGQGATRQFTIRFPMEVSNQWRATLEGKHWTNHPEWVKTARRERHSNPRTGESMDWYCVDFDLGAGGSEPGP